jgi:hypothetical protein
VTAKSGHNAAGFRKPQKSGFSQLETFVTASLFTLKNRHIMTVTNVIIWDDFVTR